MILVSDDEGRREHMEERSPWPASGAPEREPKCLIFEACHSCRSLYIVPERVLDSPFFCEASTGICVWCLANCSAEELHELNRSRKLMRLNLDSLCANLKQRAKVRLDDLRSLKQQLAANASATADTRRSFEEAIERAKTTAHRSERKSRKPSSLVWKRCNEFVTMHGEMHSEKMELYAKQAAALETRIAMCQQAAETALAQLRVCKLVTEDALVQLSSCPGSSSDAPALTASSQDVCQLVFSSPEIGHVFYAHSPLKTFPGYSAPLRVLGELRRAAMLLLAEGRSLEIRAFEIDFLWTITKRQADDAQLQSLVADICDVNDVAEAPIPPAMLYRARDVCALLDYLSSAKVLSSALSTDQLLVLLSERDGHLQHDSVLFSQVQTSMLGVIRQSLINVELEKPVCIAHELSELWRPLCPLWLARLREREKELILSVFTASALTQLPELQLEIHAQARAKSSINFSELPGIKDVVAKVKQLASPDIRGCIPGILHSVVVAAHWANLGCEKDGGMHAGPSHVLSACGMGGGLPFAAEASASDVEHCADEDAPDHGTARLDFDVLRATISGELSAAQLCALIEHALRANRYAFAALLAHEALTVHNMGMAIPVACVFLGAIAALSAAPPQWVQNELSLCGVQALSQPRSAQSMAEYGALCRRALCCEGAWHASAGAALEDLVVPQTAAALLARFSSALTATAIGTQSATVKLFSGCSTHVLDCSRVYSWDSRSSPMRRLLSTEMTNNKQAVKVCLQLARTQDPPPDFELRADSARAHLRGGGCSTDGAAGSIGTTDGGCENGGADGDVIEVSCMQLSDGELHELNMLAFLCGPYFDFFERVGEDDVLRVCGANAKGILRQLHKLCSCETLMSGVCFPSDDASTHLKLFMSSMSCGAAAHHLLCVARTEELRSPLIERSPQALDVLRDVLRACTLRAVRAGGSSSRAMLTRCRTVVEALLLSVAEAAELQTMPVRLIQFGSFPPISITPPAHVHAKRALATSFDYAVRAEAVPMVTVAEAVARQVEYYFSAANLAKDRYLRGLMDSKGWVDIAAIASFNRMRKFQLPVDAIAGMLTSSPQLDVDRDEARGAYLVRSRLHWTVFVSPA